MRRKSQRIAGVIEMTDKANQKLEELRHKRDQARLGGG